MIPEFPPISDLDDCLSADRSRLSRRLSGLRRRLSEGKPVDRALAGLRDQIRTSRTVVERRREQVPSPDFPPELPISGCREEIGQLIARHQVIVLCGETGSGKSTQLPKICLALGRGIHGRIGHTQPRRIAARSLCSRISQELGRETGTTVGYKVRFKDHVRPETSIKLMTDGILLAEIQQDRRLEEYDTLIIDEAHERSLNIDFLLGYLRELLPRRPDLKVIITSATIDPDSFARHFRGAPVINVSGRTYPVEIRYRAPESPGAGERDEPMQQAIVDAVDELGREGPGDVLVFLSGEREIRETAEHLRKHRLGHAEVLPLFARLSAQDQARVFKPHAGRRIVLATNVAETSLTVPGIRYVVDTGYARISRYSHRSKVQRLPVEPVSRASADQRKGRCGRLAAGVCVRLYTEEDFEARQAFTEPEILRTNLASVILQMKVLGFGEIEAFPFVDPPDRRLVRDGYRLLQELGAVGADGRVTHLGRQLARLPVDPRIGRMLWESAHRNCLREVLVIAAALSIQDPRERPLDKQQAADEAHALFRHEHSDFLGLLNLWDYLEVQRRHLTRRKFQRMCRDQFLNWSRVEEWHDVHHQLRAQTHEMGFCDNAKEGSYEEVHRSLLTGLLGNIGFRTDTKEYLGARGSRFWIWPGSGLFEEAPKWIVAAERVETAKHYGRTVARIKPEWAEAAAGHLVNRSYSEPHWQAKRGQVSAYEKVSLYGLTLVPRRKVNYGPINPVEAREIFIRFALVEGDLRTRAPFFRHNRELIRALQGLEHKARRRGILVDEAAIYDFYDRRVPAGIYSAPQFEKWLRQASRENRKLLHMTESDLMQQGAEEVTAERFPDTLDFGGLRLPLEYRFEPGGERDGVSLTVPLAVLNQVSEERAGWLVPGLLEERVTALLRGLPKQLRKRLVPVPDYAKRLAARLEPSDRPFLRALGEEIRRVADLHVPEDAWDESALPPHLRMRYRVVDDEGRTLGDDRDLAALRRRLGGRARASFRSIPATALERAGLKDWSFGELPETVELDRGGVPIRGWPALVDERDSVALRVLDSQPRAEAEHRAGLRRLFMLRLAQNARSLRKGLPDLQRMRLQYAKAARGPEGADPAGSPGLEDELIALAFDLTFFLGQPPVRDRDAFEQRIRARKGELAAVADDTCALTGRILDLYQAVRKTLAAVTQVNWMPSVTDMHAQLERLVYIGFLLRTPYEHLRDYPRYLQALQMRADKLRHAAARDRQRLETLRPLQELWLEREQSCRAAGRSDERVEELRWMIEELRVSLFAQELGTAYPVSVKRIERRWRELGL
ncbi:MAG: ATP-dependent RNA helicase HrpA [Chromatiales bacterium]